MLRALDKCSKWIVSCSVVATLASKTSSEHMAPCFYVMCALVTALLGKGLKRILRQPRPPNAPHRVRHEDSGMPSSHAVSASFLAVAAIVGLHRRQLLLAPPGGLIWSSVLLDFQGTWVLVALAGVVITLRVLVGHHTIPQVVVGVLFGGVMACCTAYIDLVYVPDVDSYSQNLKDGFFIVFLFVAGYFVVKYVRRWVNE